MAFFSIVSFLAQHNVLHAKTRDFVDNFLLACFILILGVIYLYHQDYVLEFSTSVYNSRNSIAVYCALRVGRFNLVTIHILHFFRVCIFTP